ncbi:unnamed protein product [Triticum turgidum subsp. durum]|uniref:Protein RETICULATA-RELATED 4, chloroplastic n=1 Tax=Triticum turgidum subsp. durum TaxID=4567 RepID=A0A9R0QY35_TRITD|nr:unnamed protein product [Triticum turgidum subsp. durum]
MAFSTPNALSASASGPASPFHLRLQPQPFLRLPALPFHRSLPLHLPSLRLTRPLLPPLPLASSGGGSNIGSGGGGGDDDLFLAKVAMECGVGIFTKTAAEYERRRENFVKELDFVIADVVMAIVADFMLVWLPAPTVSLQPALSVNAGAIAKFFHNCPDNAFQVALAGSSYTFLQRFGAIMRNGAKLFAVGTSASLIGTGVTNAIIKARKTVNKDDAGEVEDIPIVSTSIAYGVYMAVSSNLRYQVLAGVIEQRMLEPLLHRHKLALSALCFAVRTGNTFLGSLLWVDYAKFIGIQ